MSSNYAGVNTYHGQITVPSDGDPAIAESVNVALRALQDDAVYFATELAKRLNVVDGGTYTMLGSNVIIQGTPNFHWGVDSFFENDVTFGATGTSNVVAGFDELRWFGAANLRGNVTIGSGPSQALDVRAAATFRENTSFLDDVTLGNAVADAITVDGTLTVNNPATFDTSVQLGVSSSHTATVGGDLTVNGDTSVQNILINGDSQIGTSGTDSHDVRGPIALHDDVTITADVDVTGDLSVSDNTVLGSGITTIPGQLVVNGAMTLNGALASLLTFSSFGRVPFRSAALNATTTVNVASGNVLVGTSTAFVTASMSDTGAANGDFMIFFKADNSATLAVTLPSGAALGSIPAGGQGLLFAVRVAGSWYGMRVV